MADFHTEPTPNPNSMKITTNAGQFTSAGMETFASEEEAEDHPYAARLLSITGIESVFITPDFATVTKQQGASWDLILPKAKEVLRDHFEGS